MPNPSKLHTSKQRAWLTARGVILSSGASKKKASGIIIGLTFREKQIAKKASMKKDAEEQECAQKAPEVKP